MKVGVITSIQHLILETIDDVSKYIEIDNKVRSKQAVNFWIGFNTQRDYIRESPLNYASHEVEGNNIMANVMSTEMELSRYTDDKMTLATYCNRADRFISDFYKIIKSSILEGKFFRINSKLSGCPIDDLSEFKYYRDINEIELHQFILNGDVDYNLSIASPTVVLENASYIPKQLIQKFCSLTKEPDENIQVITDFKQKTILFKENDFVKLFSNGIKNGMVNIVFETTMQDYKQIENLKLLFGHVASIFPNVILNFYIKTYDRYKELFNIDINNIIINFI